MKVQHIAPTKIQRTRVLALGTNGYCFLVSSKSEAARLTKKQFWEHLIPGQMEEVEGTKGRFVLACFAENEQGEVVKMYAANTTI